MSIENNTNNNSSVSFDESNNFMKSRDILGEPKIPSMVNFLIRRGIVKNPNQAMYILFFIIILFIALSIFLIFKSTTVPPAFPDSKSNSSNIN
jgi:K+-transporting ATPase A subunit